MTIKTIFLILGGVLTFVALVPYMIDIVKQKTKPRLVSWFNWSLLTGISTAAALSAKQYPSAALTFAGAVGCTIIVVLGLKHGNRKFELFDVICQMGAILGLILWVVFDNPLVAIVATTAIDFIASLPTFKHCWQKPHEETTIAYLITAIAAVFTLLAAINKSSATGLIFPIYIIFLDTSFTATLLFSPNRHEHLVG